MDDTFTIPDFLRVKESDIPRRQKATEEYVRKLTKEGRFNTPIPTSERKRQVDEYRKEAKRKAVEELEARRKAKAPKGPIDRTGMRWDTKKGKWVKDDFAHLCSPAPAPSVSPSRPARKAGKPVPANAFGIPEGTNRDKLAKAMAARIGEEVSLIEWSKAVYGKENPSACSRVMDGFILDLKKRRLKFEIVKDKNKKGEVTYGLYETD